MGAKKARKETKTIELAAKHSRMAHCRLRDNGKEEQRGEGSSNN
jgi:hypothetical protein